MPARGAGWRSSTAASGRPGLPPGPMKEPPPAARPPRARGTARDQRRGAKGAVADRDGAVAAAVTMAGRERTAASPDRTGSTPCPGRQRRAAGRRPARRSRAGPEMQTCQTPHRDSKRQSRHPRTRYQLYSGLDRNGSNGGGPHTTRARHAKRAPQSGTSAPINASQTGESVTPKDTRRPVGARPASHSRYVILRRCTRICGNRASWVTTGKTSPARRVRRAGIR